MTEIASNICVEKNICSSLFLFHIDRPKIHRTENSVPLREQTNTHFKLSFLSHSSLLLLFLPLCFSSVFYLFLLCEFLHTKFFSQSRCCCCLLFFCFRFNFTQTTSYHHHDMTNPTENLIRNTYTHMKNDT